MVQFIKLWLNTDDYEIKKKDYEEYKSSFEAILTRVNHFS